MRGRPVLGLVVLAAVLAVLGIGCGKKDVRPPNSYPGKTPFVAPTGPPPGADYK